jgi:hypothetical protein
MTSAMPPNAGSPAGTAASAALAAEVRKKVRETGLVLWLDVGAQYGDLVDALAGGAFAFSYPVVSLRGSYLELMLALEPYGSGLHPEHVLVHLPGLNKDTVKETPVFELYKAGKVFEKNLATLAAEAAVGVAKPDELDAFVRGSGAAGLTLQNTDAWLAGLRAEPRDQTSILLDALGVDGVVLDLVGGAPRLREHLPAGGAIVLAFLEKHLGLDAAWRRYRIGDRELGADALGTAVASWLMAVEFVHDLKESPLTPELHLLAKIGPFAAASRRLAERFRDVQPDDYEHFATEFQETLVQERTSHHAGALGSIDTFRFEEATTRIAALGALQRGEWASAEGYAVDRTPEQCFWVKRSQPLQRTWELIRLAARTGLDLDATKSSLAGCNSLDEAVGRYTDKLAKVDRAHRLFEQRAHAVLASDLDEYDALLEVRTTVRAAYRTWSDTVNRAFAALCIKYGPLPSPSLRQRGIYDEVVHPRLGQGQRVAFFMVDALRFEMAQGLAAELTREKFQVNVGARLAELPTETKIGMNALAPVARGGRLRLVMKDGAIKGFATGEFTVFDPAGRVRAMSQQSLQSKPAEDIMLEDFLELNLAQVRKRLSGKPDLVVVRSRELDSAGEHGLHLGTFDQTMLLLKSAISLLSQAGIERFVITSDHGFLLQDGSAENLPFGASKRAADRRHALLDAPSGKPDVVEIPLSALDYDVEGTGPTYLVFRPDTALWQTKDKIAPFVHGGNSLQERVIPVLEVERHTPRGKTMSKYEVVARAEPAHLGRQRLRLAVRLQNRETGSLGFLAPRGVSLALRIPGHPNVTVRVLDAGPPATVADGRIIVPPNRDEALVEFELEGEEDAKVRVEVFHPDAAEDVTPKIVEGFFDVARNRRLGKSRSGAAPATTEAEEPIVIPPPPLAPAAAPGEPAPADLGSDEHYRRVLQIIADRRMIDEVELGQVLGSPRRVRAFARHIDALRSLVPFEIEILTVNGMKAYARKD